MRSKTLTNKKLEPLTDMQVARIELIYRQIWEERGTMGGAKVWLDVIVEYLEQEGYEIKKGPKAKTGE